MESKWALCPKCGSDQLSANKKGFGAGKAIAGAVVTGGVGLLAGFIGSRKIYVTCLACGHQWTLLIEQERKAKAKREKRIRENPPSPSAPRLGKIRKALQSDDWVLIILLGLVFLVLFALSASLS